MPEMINSNYVTSAQVKKMIDAKHKRGNFNIKSEEDIKKLYEVAENVFNNMEDLQDSMKIVSGNYDRNLTNKLYEISSNVGPQQLQSIVADNIKTENENSLNTPSSSSSSFSDLDSFKEESKLPGESFGDESEDETDTATEGASESEILPEDSNLLIQNNNSGGARPVSFTPHPSDQSLVRKMLNNQNKKDPSLRNFV
jgi:hypothetical protein